MSFSDSPLSTDEPLALIDSVSAESRFAASSNDDDVRVDDSKKTLTTSRPRSVGSFFVSRSCESANERAVASSRSTSSRSRSATDSRWRRVRRARRQQLAGNDVQVGHDCLPPPARRPGRRGRPRRPRASCTWTRSSRDGRQVLADVVGPDRQLAVAAVGEHGELDARRAAVLEQRVDRGADRAAGVEDVVDEDHGAALELEVELRVAHDRLRAPRRLAAADVDVVAVEGDVELAEVELELGALLDQAAQALGERDAARVDADERDGVELLVALDDLVRDPRERARRSPRRRAGPPGRRLDGMLVHRSPFRPRWTELKGIVSEQTSQPARRPLTSAGTTAFARVAATATAGRVLVVLVAVAVVWRAARRARRRGAVDRPGRAGVRAARPRLLGARQPLDPRRADAVPRASSTPCSPASRSSSAGSARGYDVLRVLQSIVVCSTAVVVYFWARSLVRPWWALAARGADAAAARARLRRDDHARRAARAARDARRVADGARARGADAAEPGAARRRRARLRADALGGDSCSRSRWSQARSCAARLRELVPVLDRVRGDRRRLARARRRLAAPLARRLLRTRAGYTPLRIVELVAEHAGLLVLVERDRAAVRGRAARADAARRARGAQLARRDPHARGRVACSRSASSPPGTPTGSSSAACCSRCRRCSSASRSGSGSGAPRPRRRTLAVAAAAFAGLIALPVGALAAPDAVADNPSLVPLIDVSSPHAYALTALAAVVACALLVWLPRRFVWLLPVVLGAVFLAVSVSASREFADQSRVAQHSSSATAPNGIDRTADRPGRVPLRRRPRPGACRGSRRSGTSRVEAGDRRDGDARARARCRRASCACSATTARCARRRQHAAGAVLVAPRGPAARGPRARAQAGRRRRARARAVAGARPRRA